MTQVNERNSVSIGVLADRFGLSTETLRVWERAGRIPRAWRTAGGHRRYGADHVRAIAALMGMGDVEATGRRAERCAPTSSLGCYVFEPGGGRIRSDN